MQSRIPEMFPEDKTVAHTPGACARAAAHRLGRGCAPRSQMTLWELLVVGVLLTNAAAVLHEERFLARCTLAGARSRSCPARETDSQHPAAARTERRTG